MSQRTAQPTMGDIHAMLYARGYIVTLCVAFIKGTEDVAIAESEKIIAQIAENDNRVIGNRSHHNCPTWRDLQLMLEGQLRVCLEYLEKNQ